MVRSILRAPVLETPTLWGSLTSARSLSLRKVSAKLWLYCEEGPPSKALRFRKLGVLYLLRWGLAAWRVGTEVLGSGNPLPPILNPPTP